MRIGIDARALYMPILKGIGIYQQNLFEILSKIDDKNEYILYYDSRQKIIPRCPKARNFSANGISIKKGDRFNLWEQIRLPSEVKKDKIDIFHSPANTTMFFKPCPVIVTIHDTIAQEVKKNRVWDRFYIDTLQPSALRKAKKIITPSEYSKNRISELIRIDKKSIEVIYNGIDSAFRAADCDEIKTKYKINKKYILNVGGESPWKNVSLLIKAYAELFKKGNIDRQLVITDIRKTEIMSGHLEEVTRLGLGNNVVILGYVPISDLVALYSNADLFVYPSLNEGFGFPPLEAMACGVPVVASNSASIPEVVGDAAILVDASKPDAMIDGISSVIRNDKLRSNLVAGGFERAKKFNWQNTARKTLDIYETVFKRN